MELIKLDLISRNNKQNGWYMYCPIVKSEGKYYRCKSIKSNCILKKENVNVKAFIISSEITPEFYAINNIKP